MPPDSRPATSGDYTVRRMSAEAELAEAWRLGRLAFGAPPAPPSPNALREQPDRIRWGAFDGSGRLLGKAVDLLHQQWWGGRLLPAADVAGVAVLPEARGRGVARALLDTLLSEARRRGAVVSALHPTRAAIYRSAGWEAAGVREEWDLPTADLPAPGSAAAGTLRPADPADGPAIRAFYRRLAAEADGWLDRPEPAPEADDPDGSEDGGCTLVCDGDGGDGDGAVIGYAEWSREAGYGSQSVLRVDEALAADPPAAARLLGALRSWESVAPRLLITRTDRFDALSPMLPVERVQVRDRGWWMHRPVDVSAAVAGRGWPPGASGSAAFRLVDPLVTGNDGCFRLGVSDGAGELTRLSDETSVPTLHVRGWTLLWCGRAGTPALRRAGLLTGPAPSGADAALDRCFAGVPPASLLDYF